MNRAKSAAKSVDKVFREIGATRSTDRHGVRYVFPDGAARLVPSNVKWGVAHLMIREAKDRYGHDDRPAIGGYRIAASDAPTVDLQRITVTEHAQQRRDEMKRQDSLTTLEIATALTVPIRVLWWERHGTYGWVGERVAVVGHVRDGWLTIRTLLWTTRELWEQNPRFDKEMTG